MGNKKMAELVYSELELIRLNKSIDDLTAELDDVRGKNPLQFDNLAVAIRRMIAAAVRKGFNGTGGREAIDGLRNDLVQFTILTPTTRHKLDETLDQCFDRAYKMGQATKEVGHNIDIDWRVEFFKAICEANTLKAISG